MHVNGIWHVDDEYCPEGNHRDSVLSTIHAVSNADAQKWRGWV